MSSGEPKLVSTKGKLKILSDIVIVPANTSKTRANVLNIPLSGDEKNFNL